MPPTYHLIWLAFTAATLAYLARLLWKRRGLLQWLSAGFRVLLVAFLLWLTEAAGTFQPPPQPLYVLVDTSNSVRKVLPLADAPLADALPEPFRRVLEQEFSQHEPHYFDVLAESPLAERRDQTPLEAALGTFVQQGGIPEGAELLLVSDGQDTSSTELPEALAAELKHSGLTLHSWFPQPPLQQEVSIRRVANPRVSFINQMTVMEVEIESDLSEGGTTSLVLMDGKSVLTQKSLVFPAGRHKETLRLQWTPNRVGESLLTLRLNPVAGEANPHDNLRYLPLSVRATRLKVLHIAGRPGWDVLHLRHMLKTMPELDLIAFFILRDPFEDAQNVPETELALIQFPVRELFLRELFKIDTVIFQNFDIQKYLRNPEFQRAFRRYLAEGGRIIALGGEQALQGQGYQELFLSQEDRLELRPQHQPRWNFAESQVLPPEYLRQQSGFQQLEVTEGDSSQLLLRTPFRLGRVDWVQDPVSWRWRFQPAFEADHQYALFWQSLLYQPLYEQQRMFWELNSLRPRHTSEQVEGSLHLPTRSPTVQAKVVEQQLGQVLFEEALAVSDQNTYIRLPKLEPGQYVLQISCGCNDMPDASLPLVIVGDWLEARDLSRNDAWLRMLTQQTGGRFLGDES